MCDALSDITIKKANNSKSRTIPEYGIANINKNIEVADMTPNERIEKFGKYGAYDAIFK